MPSIRKLRAAWDRIESLGSSGVWDGDNVIVSFADSQIADEDLDVFTDFPIIQFIDLTGNDIGDEGLNRLIALPHLETLVLVGTTITVRGLNAFRVDRPNVRLMIYPHSENEINLLTGEPFGS